MPLKELHSAKSRLAGFLNPAQRQALVLAMALDQIDTMLSHPKVAELAVLAGSGWSEQLARYACSKAGADFQLLPEDSLSAEGLNALLTSAVDRLSPEACLVLHGDLPLLKANDLDALCAELDKHPVVLCPDTAQGGTNGLAFRSGAQIEFEFGENSFAKHQRQVLASADSYGILDRGGFSLDIDSPQDVFYLFRELERNGSLGVRLSRWLSEASGYLGALSTPRDGSQFTGDSAVMAL